MCMLVGCSLEKVAENDRELFVAEMLEGQWNSEFLTDGNDFTDYTIEFTKDGSIVLNLDYELEGTWSFIEYQNDESSETYVIKIEAEDEDGVLEKDILLSIGEDKDMTILWPLDGIGLCFFK